MELIKCPSCGNQVSKIAEKCPNCGHPIKPRSSGMGCLVTAVSIVAVLLLILAAIIFTGGIL